MQCQKCLLSPERAAIPQENSRARAIKPRWQLRLYSTARRRPLPARQSNSRKMVTWQRYEYVSTGSLRRGKTDRCCLSFRPFQAPRTQPTQQRHSWRLTLGTEVTPSLLARADEVIE